MHVALRPFEELAEQYGPMRTVVHTTAETAVPRQQAPTYVFNLLGGEPLRESLITDAQGLTDLYIRFVRYIDPVSLWPRFAVDYWSTAGFWATDHPHRAVAEAAYEEAVRDEFAAPTLRLARDRSSLATFYSVTDVAA
ncbi:hypothetical protein ACWGMW_29870 [Streptomyces albidoflavus]